MVSQIYLAQKFENLKLRKSCENYCQVKMSYQYRTAVGNLVKRNYIIVLKQEKGRGLAIMDKSQYTDKCLSLLKVVLHTSYDILYYEALFC